jgi:hypothetical protein
MTEISSTDIALPDDDKKSRLLKPTRPDGADDEIVRAADRFAAFRRKYTAGFVDTDLERVIEHPDGHVTYVIRANVWTGEPEGRPDASAWAQGSTRDANAIIAAAPLESADTIARSRAMRNLGILAGVTHTSTSFGTPRSDEETGQDVAAAREAAEISQKELADQMRERGFKWSQATVWSVEKGERPLRLVEAQHLADAIGFASGETS